jgi:hypothetical protein
MFPRKLLIFLTIFSSGLLIGSQLAVLVAPAEAGQMQWAEVADDPEFRAAVIKVIDSCIVENAIIFCN